jgi:hypothetical protein
VTAGVAATVLDAAARVSSARSERALRQAVDRFVGGLSLLPDARPGALDRDEIRKIRAAAELVVAHIEELLDTIQGMSAQRLVSAIYEIRRLLEELDRWERHFSAPAAGALR